jgi:hypothetical protein
MPRDTDEAIRRPSLRDVERRVRQVGKDQRLREAAMDVNMTGTTLDARGRPLQEGDEIILNAKGLIYYRVAKITPNLDPKAPPDLLLVHIAAIIPFYAKRDALNPEFIRVRTLQEAGPMNFSLMDLAPADSPTDPPAEDPK